LGKGISFQTKTIMQSSLPIAASVVCYQRGLIAISRRKHTDTYSGFYQIPGGSANPGETPLQCAVRELYEETALWVSPSRLELIGSRIVTKQDGTQFEAYRYGLEMLDNEELINHEPEKADTWMWIHPGVISRFKMIPNNVEFIVAYWERLNGRPPQRSSVNPGR
jgi:8-oxo-dGTP pyrophosphatase MutT (NUDIX family)